MTNFSGKNRVAQRATERAQTGMSVNKKVRILVLSAVAAAILAGCGAKDNTEPPKPLVPFSATLKVNTVWTQKGHDGTDEQYLSLGAAVADKHVATVDYKGWVNLYDESSGRVIWQTHVGAPFSASPTLADGKVFAPTLDGQLVALDEVTGKTLWTAVMPSSVLAAVAVSDNFVVVHVHNGDVLALTADTGKQVWLYQGSTPELTLEGDSAPVIADNLAIVGFANGEVQAFSLQTGQSEWQTALKVPTGSSPVTRMVDVLGAPVVANNTVYAASYQGNAVALNMQGSETWLQPMSSYAGLTVGQGKVIVTDADSHVWALDQNTGHKLWVQDGLEARFVTAPALVDNYVVVGDYQGYVHWLSLSDGHFVARSQIDDSGIKAQPVVDNGQVFVTTNNGKVADLAALQ